MGEAQILCTDTLATPFYKTSEKIANLFSPICHFDLSCWQGIPPQYELPKSTKKSPQF